jgi:HEAT repeat protein
MDEVIEGLMAIVKNTNLDEEKRRDALVSLKEYAEDPRVEELFLSLFDDKQVAVRYFAKKIYNQIQAKKQKNLQIKQWKKRSSIYEKLPPGKRVAEIKKAIEQATNRKEVASLIIELGKTQDPTAAPILKQYLSSEWDRWRANAVEALEMIPGNEFLPWVLELKNDSDNRTRGNVAKFLWTKGEKEEAFSILKEMIQSDPQWMKDSAIYVLKVIGNNESIEVLKIALNDLSEEIRVKAHNAIEEIKEKLAEKRKITGNKSTIRKKIISSTSQKTPPEQKGGLLNRLKNLWKG